MVKLPELKRSYNKTHAKISKEEPTEKLAFFMGKYFNNYKNNLTVAL